MSSLSVEQTKDKDVNTAVQDKSSPQHPTPNSPNPPTASPQSPPTPKKTSAIQVDHPHPEDGTEQSHHVKTKGQTLGDSDDAGDDDGPFIFDVDRENVVHVNVGDMSLYETSKLVFAPPPSAPSPLLSANSNLGTTNHHDDNENCDHSDGDDDDDPNNVYSRSARTKSDTQDNSEDSADDNPRQKERQNKYRRPAGFTTATTAMTSTSSAQVAASTILPPSSSTRKADAVGGGSGSGSVGGNGSDALPIAPKPPYIGQFSRENFVRVVTMYLEGRLSHPCASPSPKDPQSVFYSVSAPGISIHFYVHRLVTYTHCSPTVFVVALIFLERIGKSHEKLQLNVMNLHRLLIAAVTVAVKLLDDRVFSNRHYGRVGGVQTSNEMSRMEVAFLKFINYDIHVDHKEYEQLFEGTLQSYHEQLDLAHQEQLRQQQQNESQVNVTAENEQPTGEQEESDKIMRERVNETADSSCSIITPAPKTKGQTVSTPAPAHSLPSSCDAETDTVTQLSRSMTRTDSNVHSHSRSMSMASGRVGELDERAKRWHSVDKTRVNSNKRKERDDKDDALDGRVGHGGGRGRRRRLTHQSKTAND